MNGDNEHAYKGIVSILIPVYNEKGYLRYCVERVLKAPLPKDLRREVILVDDGSTDGTREIVAEIADKFSRNVRAFYQPENMGKGAAIRRGITEMRGAFVIFQDADLEYDPNEYAILLQPILEGFADVVYGSRFAPRTMRRVFNYHHAIGNKFLTCLSNVTTGLDLTDMETGYKAFRADVLKTIPLRSNRFGIEPEISSKIAKRYCKVYEVPICYYGRTYDEGKKINWKDGLAAIFTILKYTLIDDCFEEQYSTAMLQSLSHARRFNRWTVRLLRPYLGTRILEIGSGIGNVSRQLPKREKLIVTDFDDEYIEILHKAFDNNEFVDVRRLDLNLQKDFDAIGESVCDTLVSLNVLEHIEDDVSALRRMRGLLDPEGRLILVLPQYRCLFGSYDKIVGHQRRYAKRDIRRRLEEAGYKVQHTRSFNFFSIPGWWLNAKLFKRKNISRWQLKLFDTSVPLFRLIEAVIPLPGLSLLVVAKRNDSAYALSQNREPPA